MVRFRETVQSVAVFALAALLGVGAGAYVFYAVAEAAKAVE